VFVERVPRGIDQLVDITAQWRNPVGILFIQSVRKLDEIPSIALRLYHIDAQIADASRQIRSISRPTR
jgi:hypothetical protein